jgi:hypothetical protein
MAFGLRERPHPSRPLQSERGLIERAVDHHRFVKADNVLVCKCPRGQLGVELTLLVQDLNVVDFGFEYGLSGHSIASEKHKAFH